MGQGLIVLFMNLISEVDVHVIKRRHPEKVCLGENVVLKNTNIKTVSRKIGKHKAIKL